MAEQKKIELDKERLRKEVIELTNARQAVRIQGGETEEELARRQVLLEEKQKQLDEMEELRDWLDNLMQNQLKQLALQALFILLALLLIPFLWKVAAYYIVAPVVQNSKPISLDAKATEVANISVSSSHPAQRLHLNQGEVLLTRVDYLQGSMGSFDKSTKWLMDWRYPFSSLAAGLCILTKIKT
ncbi:MAG: PspA/IM30 family protein, partial [Akkermansiaceae bacterium]